MTKEDIEKLARSMKMCANHELQRYIAELDRFFESNVCIPKGANRHPYADVIHQKLEDMTIELEVKQDRARYVGWVKHIGLEYMKDEYRIKKSEPVYEYQFIVNGQVQSCRFYTIDEIIESVHSTSRWIAIEETKRKRKL